MRVNLVVMGNPRWQLTHGADEGFSHSVALRTFDGDRYRFKTDVSSEAAGSGRAVFFITGTAITVLISDFSFRRTALHYQGFAYVKKRYLETPFLKLKTLVNIRSVDLSSLGRQHSSDINGLLAEERISGSS